jgi:hypothetical protein
MLAIKRRSSHKEKMLMAAPFIPLVILCEKP